MHKVYISIGSNIGNRKKNIRAAIERLKCAASSIRCSKPYRTAPYGYLNQPDFINMALEIETDYTPSHLLKELQEIEASLGRVRTIKWGQRTIDLDIIFYDNDIIEEAGLIIPHPDMQNRIFVLKPLMDLCPEYIHPLLKKSISSLYSDLASRLQ
jgi:2-amino-4-hydroxy-6-hydroxymethyldihydropteridine diphosphokinase